MTDLLVIGGGLAGSAAALLAAEAGRSVELVEREPRAAEKVCGEFLSREAQLYLSSLGVDCEALGAVPIDAVRMAAGAESITVALPFAATSLSRGVLDEALLARASGAGVVVRRGSAVHELARTRSGFRARLADGRLLHADAAFVATGKHDLRGWSRPRGLHADLIAFKIHWRLRPRRAAELERHVELTLFGGGYAGLQPIEGGFANLCLLVERRRFAELGKRWDELLASIRRGSPRLDERLAGATPRWARPLALSAIPYGHVQYRSDGVFRLGDQAAVIPSFAGDGMSIALHSARLAVTAYLHGESAGVFQRRLARDVAGQVLLATALSYGLVRAPTQRALRTLAARCPGLVTSVVAGTRISDARLVRAGREAMR